MWARGREGREGEGGREGRGRGGRGREGRGRGGKGKWDSFTVFRQGAFRGEGWGGVQGASSLESLTSFTSIGA